MGYLLAALTGGFLFFNSQATPNKVAGRIETALRQQFPGAQVDVDIKGKRGLNVVKGKFREVRLSMSNFKTAGVALPPVQMNPNPKNKGRIGRATLQLRDFDFNGLKVELAELEMGDVVYDLDALKKSQLGIASVGPGHARLIVPAASLQAFMQGRVKDVKNARLSLQNGRVRLTGTRATPLLGDLPFVLTARPEARNGNGIWLADTRVTLDETELPPALTQGLIGQLNPIFVFDADNKLPFRINIKTLSALNDKLELGGDVTFVPATVTAPATTTPPATLPQPMLTTPATNAPAMATN